MMVLARVKTGMTGSELRLSLNQCVERAFAAIASPMGLQAALLSLLCSGVHAWVCLVLLRVLPLHILKANLFVTRGKSQPVQSRSTKFERLSVKGPVPTAVLHMKSTMEQKLKSNCLEKKKIVE